MPNKKRIVAYGPWRPDAGELQNGVNDIDGFTPVAFTSLDDFSGSADVVYETVNQFIPLQESVPGKIVGHISMRDKDGHRINIVGTDRDIWSFNELTQVWSSIQPMVRLGPREPMPRYNFSEIMEWNFVRFGDDIIAAAKRTSVTAAPFPLLILKYENNGFASAFVPLEGGPPQASQLAVIHSFLFGAAIYKEPKQVKWSGILNPEKWPINSANIIQFMAGTTHIEGGGDIRAIISGDIGYVILENSIARIEYQGPPTVFNVRVIHDNIGTASAGSVCYRGADVFFYSDSGFYRLNRFSGELTNIGLGKVNEWFGLNTDAESIAGLRGEVNVDDQSVWWLFQKSQTRGKRNVILIYHYGFNEWSKIDLSIDNESVEDLGTFFLPPISFDALDTTQYYPQGLDGTPNAPSPDSPLFAGGEDIVIFEYDDQNDRTYVKIRNIFQRRRASIETKVLYDKKQDKQLFVSEFSFLDENSLVNYYLTVHMLNINTIMVKIVFMIVEFPGAFLILAISLSLNNYHDRMFLIMIL